MESLGDILARVGQLVVEREAERKALTQPSSSSTQASTQPLPLPAQPNKGEAATKPPVKKKEIAGRSIRRQLLSESQDKNSRLRELVSLALEIETEAASTTNGYIGYMARALTIATMPHSKPDAPVFERCNGSYTLSMVAPPSIGLPYGTKPRLLMAWIAREAVRTGERKLVLGDSLSRFMLQLGLIPTGGRWGTIAPLKEQMKRLFSCSISCIDDRPDQFSIRNVRIVDEADLWWTPQAPEQAGLWESTLLLSEPFHYELTNYPVPIDLRLVNAFKQSSMELDIYFWLTHKASYTVKPTRPIPWELLKLQFGSDYANTPTGLRAFKFKFLRHLKHVVVAYSGARLEEVPRGLIFRPSATSVPRPVTRV
jgi:hypothetical protein